MDSVSGLCVRACVRLSERQSLFTSRILVLDIILKIKKTLSEDVHIEPHFLLLNLMPFSNNCFILHVRLTLPFYRYNTQAATATTITLAAEGSIPASTDAIEPEKKTNDSA